MKPHSYVSALGGVCCLIAPLLTHAEDHNNVVERALLSGDLAKADAVLREHIELHPKDDEARFGLGMTQFLLAVERVSRSLQQPDGIGPRLLKPRAGGAIDQRPELPPGAYAIVRGLFIQLARDIEAAEATLAEISDPDVKLRLPVGRIRFDLNGDGKTTDDEELRQVFSWLRVRRRGNAQQEDLSVAFDLADVHWFRGQCHAVMAVCEFLLAHDWKRLLEQLYFARTLGKESGASALDAVAFIHLIDWPVAEPKRMLVAHEHLVAMVRQFQRVHEAADAEIDDDREWIAGPAQVGAVSRKRISKAAFARRRAFLDEAKRLLAGDKLLPLVRHYPNFKQERGVNMRRVFTEPRRYDLILWIQGAAAEPYLEEGDVSEAFWPMLRDSLIGGDWREFGLLPF